MKLLGNNPEECVDSPDRETLDFNERFYPILEMTISSVPSVNLINLDISKLRC